MRAAARFAARRSRDPTWRATAAIALTVTGVAAVIVAAELGRTTGAVVGTTTSALVLATLAAATWPWHWTQEEHTHYELEAIWHEPRADGDRAAPWPRLSN